jgi:hypothetical protein
MRPYFLLSQHFSSFNCLYFAYTTGAVITHKQNSANPTGLPFQLQHVSQMRQGDMFIKIYSKFLPRVHGMTSWRSHSKNTQISSFVTVSTEAFMLLIFENHWSNWVEQAEREYENTLHENLRRKERQNITAPNKYTSHLSGRNKGFSQAGIDRFNELCILVQKDRALDKSKSYPSRAEDCLLMELQANIYNTTEDGDMDTQQHVFVDNAFYAEI